MSTRLHDTISSTTTAGTAGTGGARRRPTTAGLLGAAAIDLVVLVAPPVALHLLRGWTALAVITAVQILALTVIALACTGWTPGLAAIGARTVTAEGPTTPGLGRAAARVALTPLTPIGSGEAGFVDGATRCRTLVTRRSRRTDESVRKPGPGGAGRRDLAETAHPRTRGGGTAGRPAAMLSGAPSAPSTGAPPDLPAGAPPSPPAVGTGPATTVSDPTSAVDSAPVPPQAPPAPEPVLQSTPAALGGILGPAAPVPRAPGPHTGTGDPHESERPIRLSSDAQNAAEYAAPGRAVPEPAETAAPPGRTAAPIDSQPAETAGAPAPGGTVTPVAPGPAATAGPIPGRETPGAQETPFVPPPPAEPAPASPAPASPGPPSAGRRARPGEPDAATASAPMRRRRRATSHRASASPAASSSPMSPSPTSPSEAPPPPSVGQAQTRTTTRETVLSPAGPSASNAAVPNVQADPRTVPREDPNAGRRAGTGGPDFVLVTGSGMRVPLEGQCVIGRAPRPAFPDDTQMVTLATSSSALSRSHLRIGFDDQQLWAEDMRSANGTVMVHPTGQQIRLKPEWRTAVAPGSVLLLADESITVEKSA